MRHIRWCAPDSGATRNFWPTSAKQINELESRPARAWQSAEESSLDTWLDKYSLYNRPEFSISYYNKGQLLGVALDILIRDATDNRASLDDVMRRMNQEYAERGRYYDDSAGVERAVEEVVSDETVREAKPSSAPGRARAICRRKAIRRPCGKHRSRISSSATSAARTKCPSPICSRARG